MIMYISVNKKQSNCAVSTDPYNLKTIHFITSSNTQKMEQKWQNLIDDTNQF